MGRLSIQVGHQRRQEVQLADIVHRDDEVAVRRGRIECRLILRMTAEVGNDLGGGAGQLRAARGRQHARVGPHEQRIVEGLAQPPQGEAGSRLAQVKLCGGFRDATRGAMQPLRISRESERLDPPLVDILVPSGHRNHRDVNVPEAEVILAEIQAILADKRFVGRSLGVVSLLGPEQAKHIDTLARSHCDVAELMRRHFKCGDAHVFQGSERDIMFLSMVVDPRSARALSGNMFEQRFNVAASRARDRMYLVRSVELKDLSQADLRAGLIGHFSKPQDGSIDESKSLVHKCDSGFERDVYVELFKRGYRVIPQVKAGSFFIDLVVEGANDTRLAIELDGDEYHGPDRWQADMNRQRVLERAGWTFWRCFASTWSLHRDEVLTELLDRLTAMGIEPVGVLEKAPSLVKSRVWQSPIWTAADSAKDILETAVT